MLKLKSYEDVIKEPSKKGLLQWALKPFKAFKFKRFLNIRDKLKLRLNLLNTVPFGVLFVFFLLVMVLSVFVANKLRMQYFANVVIGAYPELVTVPLAPDGKPLYMSPLDRILAEFHSINAMNYIIIWAILTRNFFKSIWQSYNPRKIQVIRRG